MKIALPTITPARSQPRGARSVLSPTRPRRNARCRRPSASAAPSACTSARCSSAGSGTTAWGPATGEPGERHLRGVGVEAVDIGVRVMGDVVLHPPGVAREAEQRVGRPADEVVPAPPPEVRAVVRIVLHAEGGQRRADQEPREAEKADAMTGVEEDSSAHEQRSARGRSAPSRTASPAPPRSAPGKVLLHLASGLGMNAPPLSNESFSAPAAVTHLLHLVNGG